MSEMGGVNAPAAEFPPKSKKEQLIDQLQEIFDLKKAANEKLRYLESFDFERMLETDPETTEKETAGYKKFLEGETQEPPESTARGKEVNEIYRQYIETRQILNELQGKEQEIREQIELERMREIPPPPQLPVEPPQRKTEIEPPTPPVEPATPEDKEPLTDAAKEKTILELLDKKTDDIRKMLDELSVFTVEGVAKYLDAPEFFAEAILNSLEKDHNILTAPDATGGRRLVNEKKVESTEVREIPRKAAMITLARVQDYRELAAATEQEGNENFLKKTRELWKEVAVHGISAPDKKTGKITLMNFSDLDGESAIGLLELAGINVKKVQYVEKGAHIPGVINMDTGNRHGVVVEDDGATAFFDHHTDDSGNQTCATKIAYETLVSLGLLEKTEWLDKLVEFVTNVDNETFQSADPKEDYMNSWKTIIGLNRRLAFDKLVRFFRDMKKKPNEPLSPKEISELNLTKYSKEMKLRVADTVETLKNPETAHFIVESQRYGKIFVDVEKPDGSKRVQGGFPAIKAFGYGAYILWAPSKNSFFISAANTLEHSFSQGLKIRDSMWIKPLEDKSALTLTLQKILTTMTDNDLNILSMAPKMEKYLQTGKWEEPVKT